MDIYAINVKHAKCFLSLGTAVTALAYSPFNIRRQHNPECQILWFTLTSFAIVLKMDCNRQFMKTLEDRSIKLQTSHVGGYTLLKTLVSKWRLMGQGKRILVMTCAES